MKTPLLLMLTLACAGCTVSEVITAEKTPLKVASLDIAESMLLDVGIMNFEPGISEQNDSDESGIYPEVRQAEARYLPYHLKTTLQGTGFWGAVRVIPSRYVFTDVTLTGSIEQSDGEFVTLRVNAEDARGIHWFEKTYSMQTGITSYSENRDLSNDPYQKVFNEIANDLRAHAAALTPEEVRRIRQLSEMKFFADMAPTVYGEYITTDEKGITSLVRLPAENDPMAERLRQIRARDHLVIDTLNEHYANFYYGIAIPYESWRETSREQNVNYRQVKRAATLRALLGVVVVAGSMSIDASGSNSAARAKSAARYVGVNRGVNTIISAWNLRQSANVHRENIKELSESFGAEAAPLVVRVEGETRRLTGTAEAQYETWRKLLKDIYRVETGFAGNVDVGVGGRSPQAEKPGE